MLRVLVTVKNKCWGNTGEININPSQYTWKNSMKWIVPKMGLKKLRMVSSKEKESEAF